MIRVGLMTTFRSRFLGFILASLLLTSTGLAGEADIVGASASLTGPNQFRFDVSVAHADEGWEHYAIAFEILDMQGNILGVRELAHPHVNEQPFTRSLGRLEIPSSITKVYIRAIDSVHGAGGIEWELALPIQ